MPVEFDRRGRDHFYKVLDPWPGMVMAYGTAAKIEAKLARIPSPVARTQLLLLRGAMGDARRRMRLVETDTAAHADRAIRNCIQATKRRPGGSGKLSNAIQSRPIGSTLPAGSVGIADIDVLDRRVVGRRNSGRYPGTAGHNNYWQVQEYGSTHLVGRTVVGFFMPGMSRPTPAQFRIHPVFEASRDGDAMMVKRPIEARYFLRDGARDAEKYRYRATVGYTGVTVRRIESIIAVGRRWGPRKV